MGRAIRRLLPDGRWKRILACFASLDQVVPVLACPYSARLPPSTWPVFGGEGQLVPVEQIYHTHYLLHNDTPLIPAVHPMRAHRALLPSRYRLSKSDSPSQSTSCASAKHSISPFFPEHLGQPGYAAAAVPKETTKRREIGELVRQSSKHPAQARRVR